MAFNENVNDLPLFYMKSFQRTNLEESTWPSVKRSVTFCLFDVTEIYNFSVLTLEQSIRYMLRKRDLNQLADRWPSVKVGLCQNFSLSTNRQTYTL